MERLECSRPTLSRLIGYMWNCLGAPIESDRHRDGYRYAEDAQDRYELPGLWFSPAELFALVSICQLLKGLQRPLVVQNPGTPMVYPVTKPEPGDRKKLTTSRKSSGRASRGRPC
ncbi:MAG: hypothetical protein ACN6I7_04310 [bacterium]|jgi:hypothetical protein